jgi:hypothetical protein
MANHAHFVFIRVDLNDTQNVPHINRTLSTSLVLTVIQFEWLDRSFFFCVRSDLTQGLFSVFSYHRGLSRHRSGTGNSDFGLFVRAATGYLYFAERNGTGSTWDEVISVPFRSAKYK